MKPFPWRAGMLTKCGIRVTEGRGAVIGERMGTGEHIDDGREDYEPDLTDAATLGALLGAVREAYGDPCGYVVYREKALHRMIWGWDPVFRNGPILRAPTEGAALLAAWEAAP